MDLNSDENFLNYELVDALIVVEVVIVKIGICRDRF